MHFFFFIYYQNTTLAHMQFKGISFGYFVGYFNFYMRTSFYFYLNLTRQELMYFGIPVIFTLFRVRIENVNNFLNKANGQDNFALFNLPG